MTTYVELQRNFHDLSDDELYDTDFLASLNDRSYGTGLDWSELLDNKRVVILAEAGSGKTREMIEQVNKLKEGGMPAFFLSLESLDQNSLDTLLSAKEADLFELWKGTPEQTAWFFLDALDELKLINGKLDRSLQRFSKAIEDQFDRARVIISCRPNDWRHVLDTKTFNDRLPIPQHTDKIVKTPDELFRDSIEGNLETSDPSVEMESTNQKSPVRTVILLPLSANQITTFVENSSIKDASGFMNELERRHAWIFARRPLDLIEIMAIWTNTGILGTQSQQHEENIKIKLKDNPDRIDNDILTNIKARAGAEALALSLLLTRTRTLKSPEQALNANYSEGVLDPAEVLPHWTEKERQVLLRRGLFDPATYGRLRFHHRTVQEYLAAQQLKTLRNRGMSTKALFRLLFDSRYGVDVVIPSMRPLAAWLTLSDEAVRQEMLRREPETLISYGDPESLSIAIRAEILKSFVSAYSKGGRRGFKIPSENIRRLANSELTPLIIELWNNVPANEDVRQLLLELIYEGRLEGCMDIARSTATNSSIEHYHRIIALRALLACNCETDIQAIVKSMANDRDSWPDSILHRVIEDLFPRYIDAKTLLSFIQRSPEKDDYIGGFNWACRDIAQTLEPLSASAIALRDGLAEIIFDEFTRENDGYDISSKFGYLVPALSTICERQLQQISSPYNSSLIYACIIAIRFARHEDYDRVKTLIPFFKSGQELRQSVFWTECAFMDAIAPKKDHWNRLSQVEHRSLLGFADDADLSWLEGSLTRQDSNGVPIIALHALVIAWYRSGQPQERLIEIRTMIGEDSTLSTALHELSKPTLNEDYERQKKARQLDDEKRKATRKEGRESWIKWRQDILENPEDAFSQEKLKTTIRNVYLWLRRRRHTNKFNVWDKQALVSVFGQKVADKVEAAFKVNWRHLIPVLLSARPEDEKNSTPTAWIEGLCGVAAEATSLNWSYSLESSEARLATIFATLELNGFAPFIYDLAKSHPSEVKAVLGKELSAELANVNNWKHLPLLNNIAYSNRILKTLLTPCLVKELQNWTTRLAGTERHLDFIISIIREGADESDLRTAVAVCKRQYSLDPNSPFAKSWLRGLFRLDPNNGIEAIVDALSQLKGRSYAYVISMFATLFGDRNSLLSEISDSTKLAKALYQLVLLAYRFVRIEDDQIHEGVYTPNERDRAVEARSFLLTSLLNTPGPEARLAILKLANEPEFSHMPDRLRFMARQRAATDSEFPPFAVSAVVELNNLHEIPPHDRDTLFDVVWDRLDDLSHDLTHYDYSDRRTMKRIDQEVEMQRTLSWRIANKSNGIFSLAREVEVADLKKTDIRFETLNGNQKMVVEVKIADNWSIKDFEIALKDQLVERYLRHSRCRAGCLLLTYHGRKKKWKNMATGKYFSFPQLVSYLKRRAQALENKRQHKIRLDVMGIDLTNLQKLH